MLRIKKEKSRINIRVKGKLVIYQLGDPRVIIQEDNMPK